MNRVLLTGASGFIGSHCIDPLLTRGFEVHAQCTGLREGLRRDVTWHAADLLDTTAGRRLTSEVRPTHLLHLAWHVPPGKFVGAPENFRWVTASLDLLEAFSEHGRRFVGAGSGYEYDWRFGYCTEGITPTVPDTVYGRCKNALRELAEGFATSRELSFAWGRIFFLYGPREHPQRLVSSVVRSLLRGEEAKSSHGLQIRDYMYVQDVADGIVALLDNPADGVYNICSGAAVTLRQILAEIARQIGRADLLRVGALPARANDAPLVVGSNQAMLSRVGWKPAFDLEKGLAHTIAWWRDSMEREGRD